MANEIATLKISDEEKLKLEYRVINAMIDVYNKIKYDTGTIDEIKIILQTISAGRAETSKIQEELLKDKKDQYNHVYFYPEVEQLLFSCIAGGITYGGKEIPHNTLHPNNLDGYRIRSLVMALSALKATVDIQEIFDDCLCANEHSSKEAYKMIEMTEKNAS
jgi:hypothetical protein